MAGFIALASVLVTLAACSGPRPPLNPPRLITSDQTDMAIQLFMQATILLSNYYGFQTIRYADIQERSARAGFSMLPFMPPETVPATPRLVALANTYENDRVMLDFIVKTYGYKTLVKYYIRTGLRASQLICRNYLLELEERNQYLEFLRKEFGVAYALATGILQMTNANKTLYEAFAISRSALDGALNAYEEYRFLNIDREAARTLVEAAQNKYAEYFLKQVDAATPGSILTAGGYTFSDALNAVSTVEYQCTRSGIRHLLNRSINNSPSNMNIDEDSGTMIFRSATTTVPATGPAAPPIAPSRPSRVPQSAPLPMAPAVVVAPAPAIEVVAPPAGVLTPGPAVVTSPAPAVVVVPAPPPVLRTAPAAETVVVRKRTETPKSTTSPSGSKTAAKQEPKDRQRQDGGQTSGEKLANDEASKILNAYVTLNGKIDPSRVQDLQKLLKALDPRAPPVLIVIRADGQAPLRARLLAAAQERKLISTGAAESTPASPGGGTGLANDDASAKLNAYLFPDGRPDNTRMQDLNRLLHEISPAAPHVLVVVRDAAQNDLRVRLLSAARERKLIGP